MDINEKYSTYKALKSNIKTINVYVQGKGMEKGEMLVMSTKGLGAQSLNPANVVT